MSTELSVTRVVIAAGDGHGLAQIRAQLLAGSTRRYRFTEATTGDAVIDACVDDHAHDCVIVDQALPDMTALEVVRAIATPHGRARAPVVVLGARMSPAEARVLLRAGAQDVLDRERISPEGLIRAMENAIERWTTSRELDRLYSLERDARARSERFAMLAAGLSSARTTADAALVVAHYASAISAAAGTVWMRRDRVSPLEVAAYDDAEWRTSFASPTLSTEAGLAAAQCIDLHDSFFQSSRAAFPLYDADGREVSGAICFEFGEAHDFAEAEREELGAVAALCAQTMERARLFERERTARKAAEEARTDADVANRAKSDFLATMSHDFRTPLNAIAGHAQLIEMEIYGPITAAQREALARIQRNGQHLLVLVNEVLNFAKLEAGRMEFVPAPLPLAELVEDIAPIVAPQFEAKHVALEFHVEQQAIAWGDRVKLQQILVNLLSNAVKFCAPGGHVYVDTPHRSSDAPAPLGDVTFLRVIDDGPGIPTDVQDKIFEPFVQGPADLVRSRDGVGLGLAISRTLARGMGGDLRVRSRSGSGASFTISLRSSTADLQAAPPVPDLTAFQLDHDRKDQSRELH